MYLWKYNTTTGMWAILREVNEDTASQWLAVFQKDEPNAILLLSKNKPSHAKGKALYLAWWQAQQ